MQLYSQFNIKGKGDFWFLVPHVRSLEVATPSQEQVKLNRLKSTALLGTMREMKTQEKCCPKTRRTVSHIQETWLTKAESMSRSAMGPMLGRDSTVSPVN